MQSQLITSVPDFKAFARASEEESPARIADDSASMFGGDGLSFGDVLDAINPLNHIPIVSDIYSSLVGHKASAGSRLAGGALFGGPIGVVASIASMMFEEGSGGKSPVQALYAAVTSPEPDTQLAAAEAPTSAVELARTDDTPTKTQAAAPVAPVTLASLAPAPARTSRIPIVDAATNALPEIPVNAAQTLLDLYGASAASAHGSYQKAQMLPYLRDVTVSKVL